MVNFIETNNLDGIDVDIEGSLLPFIGANYNRFVLELKEHLHAKGKAITAALMPISIGRNSACSANAALMETISVKVSIAMDCFGFILFPFAIFCQQDLRVGCT